MNTLRCDRAFFLFRQDDWNEELFDAETGRLERRREEGGGRMWQVVMMRRWLGEGSRKGRWKLKKRQDGAAQVPKHSQQVTSGTCSSPAPPPTVSAQARC